MYAAQYCKEKRVQDGFKEKTSYFQDQYLIALKTRNIEKRKMPKISLPNPDIHKEERDELQLKLSRTRNISDCRSLALEITKLGPACSESFGTWLCHNLGQEYRELVVSCISNIAADQGKSDLCSDKDLQKEICKNWGNLLAEQENLDLKEPSTECMDFVKEECLLSFAKKSVVKEKDSTGTGSGEKK